MVTLFSFLFIQSGTVFLELTQNKYQTCDSNTQKITPKKSFIFKLASVFYYFVALILLKSFYPWSIALVTLIGSFSVSVITLSVYLGFTDAKWKNKAW